MPPDRFTTCQSGNGLVHHSLKNRSGQVFLGSAFVDQRLDIGLGKYAAAGRDGVEGFIIFRIFV